MRKHQKHNGLILNEETFPILEQISTGMPGGFFIYRANGDGELLYSNRALLRIYGCEDMEDFKRHTGYTFRGMVHPEDWERVDASIWEQISGYNDDLDYVEYRIHRKDGEIRWIEDYGHFVHTEHYGDVFYVFVEDATERHMKQLSDQQTARLAEERLETQHKLLEAALHQARQASRAKTIFLRSMSHDLRTPMNAIIGFTALAAAHTEDPALVRDYLEKISSASQHLLGLINDVLDMSRIESGQTGLKTAPCSLNELFTDLRAITETDAAAKRLDFTIEPPAITDDMIVCDRLRLQQVLVNVVSNAVNFTPEGRTVQARVEQVPETRTGWGRYVFTVRDTGIGMHPDFLQHIYEPFERERTSTISGIQGAGLGLTITKSIVDMMNGTIQVDSKEGQGTVFTITLRFQLAPQPVVQKTPEDVTGPIWSTPENSFAGRHILLVEDNELNLEIARTILEEAGFTVTAVCNGAEAVEQVSGSVGRPFDLVLMDLQMPVLDGFGAARAIRALNDPKLSALPILAMTANAFAEDKQRAKEAGMNGHLSKPIEIEKFIAALHEALGE